MNKKSFISLFCCLIIAVFLPPKLFSLNLKDFQIRWDVGSLAIGGVSNSEDSGVYCNLRVFNLHFIDEESGLGASISPFVWSGYPAKNTEQLTDITTFVNCELYYDFFHYRKAFSLEPVLSFNCLGLSNLWDYQLDFGLRFGLYYDPIIFKHMRAEYFTTKAGLKIVNNKPYAYFDVGINLLELLYIIAYAKYEDVSY